MTILEENSHTILFIEHDPSLYKDAQEMTERISQAMRAASQEAAVLLYSPGADPYFEELFRNADRVFLLRRRSSTRDENCCKGQPEKPEESDDAGSVLVILPDQMQCEREVKEEVSVEYH
jgi:hypothetical protein